MPQAILYQGQSGAEGVREAYCDQQHPGQEQAEPYWVAESSVEDISQVRANSHRS